MKTARYYPNLCTGWSICIVCAHAVFAELCSLELVKRSMPSVSLSLRRGEQGRPRGRGSGGEEAELREEEEN
jgi:hypothetical protein